MTLQSANHTVIGVVNTTQCHQLVWSALFFYSVKLLFTVNFVNVICIVSVASPIIVF